MKQSEIEKAIFETDGMSCDTYLWMWYCDKCHSTLPPFLYDAPQECPYCEGEEKGTLRKARVKQL